MNWVVPLHQRGSFSARISHRGLVLDVAALGVF